MVNILEASSTIVVAGRLNPFIFQPEWLRHHKIIGPGEADAAALGKDVAQGDFVHRELTVLKLTAASLTVDTSRFAITATEEPFVKVKDFAASCFRLLSHTPVTAVGINVSTTFRLDDKQSWHELGDRLAPKEPWEKLFGPQDGERKGGLKQITMLRLNRPDDFGGRVEVTLQALQSGKPDTKIEVNDHFQIAEPGKFSDGLNASKLIEECWDNSQKRSEELCQSIIELAAK